MLQNLDKAAPSLQDDSFGSEEPPFSSSSFKHLTPALPGRSHISEWHKSSQEIKLQHFGCTDEVKTYVLGED